LRSINSNRGRSKSNLLLQIALITLVYINKSSESSGGVSRVVVASSVLSGVGIASLSINTTVGDDVLHGLGHETSIATLVSLAGRAIHKVLFRERNHLLSLVEVMATFSRSSGGERPARTALFLVLDVGDSTVSSPVKLSRERGTEFLDYVDWLSSVSGSKEGVGELRGGEISKLVHRNGESLLGLVVRLNEVQVLSENLISVLELLVRVALLVLLHPEGESRLVFKLS